MKKVDIRKQPRLGLGKTFSLTVNGIRYRLFRSAITMVVITVAIAFLMNSLSESLLKKSMRAAAANRIRAERLAAEWVARLTMPGTIAGILQETAQTKAVSPRYRENMNFGGFSQAEMQAYGLQAREARGYLEFFAKLNYADRRQLVHTAVATGIFDRLQAAGSWQRFTDNLVKMPSVKMDISPEKFRSFLEGWPGLKARTAKIIEGRRQTIAGLSKRLAGRSLIQVLAGEGRGFFAEIRKAGFMLSPQDAATITAQARALQIQRLLDERIGKPKVKQVVAAELNLSPREVTSRLLWHKLLKSEKRAGWTLRLFRLQWALEKTADEQKLLVAAAAKLKVKPEKLGVEMLLRRLVAREELAEWFLALPEAQVNKFKLSLNGAAAVELAARKREVEKLLAADRHCEDVGEGLLGLGQRMGWLLLVSLVVCVVGIANAMLMSVTERFREIATLKCLGALDGFIMLMFVFEAAMLGVVGGVLGAVLGTVIGLGRMRALFGSVLWSAVNLPDLVVAGLAAVLVGIILAVVAAIWPSLRASRLAPMEAMRIE